MVFPCLIAWPAYHEGIGCARARGLHGENTDMAEMIERLGAMLARGQDNMLLRFTLGKAYAEQEQYTEAVTHLRAALAFDATYSVAWKWLGRALLAQDDAAGAREAWERGAQCARERGDKQVEKEIGVFLRRLDKAAEGSSRT